jgi:hypothetical protein
MKRTTLNTINTNIINDLKLAAQASKSCGQAVTAVAATLVAEGTVRTANASITLFNKLNQA